MKVEDNPNEHENLKNEAPFLFGLKKEEPYSAPLGYFEKFQVELTDKIQRRKNAYWTWFLKPVFWAPAMIILITGSVFLFNKNDQTEETAATNSETVFNLNEVSLDVLDAYVYDHLLAQVNTDEILEITGHENISLGTSSEINIENENNIPEIEHIDEKEMEEYIMENLEEMTSEI